MTLKVFLLANESMTGYTSVVDGGLTALGPIDPVRERWNWP